MKNKILHNRLAILNPTILNDFSDEYRDEVARLMGTVVEVIPNRDTTPISYGRYKGQHRWEIKESILKWLPCEDFIFLDTEENKEKYRGAIQSIKYNI